MNAWLLHRRFEVEAQRHPHRPAVTFQDEDLCYAALNRRANQLAHRLRALGVGPEQVAGIHLERSVDMVVAVLAVLKAGGAYLPLDPAHPTGRLADLVADAHPQVLVTASALRGRLARPGATVVALDAERASLAGEPDDDPDVAVAPDNLACLIYTSGSTGRPKGVGLSHRNLVSAFRAWEERYPLRVKGATHLQMAGFSFDVCTGDLVRALLSGGRLVLCPREALLDPPQLDAILHRHTITTVEMTPTVLRLLLDHLEIGRRTLGVDGCILVGGETLTREEYRRARRMGGPNARVLNTYGVTEATVDATWFEATGAELADGASVPIGRPFEGVRVLVLDRHLRPVPVGGSGELYLAGPFLARGYHRRPGATAQRFVPAPGGERLYRTGDLVRQLPDGELEFLGRLDDQVKVRGVRVHLAEVEAVLARHPAVRQVVVAAREHHAGQLELVAYVVRAAQAAAGPPELREHAAALLPPTMVPGSVVALDAFPLTPNGKVDRRALLARIGPAPARAMRPPRTATEATLAAIWEHVLGCGRVGVDEDFFELGGHSLYAAQVVARARAALGVGVPIGALFDHTTVAKLARVVERLQTGDPTAIPRRPGGSPSAVPLSPAQRRLWLLQELWPASAVYNIPIVLRLSGPMDLDALRSALDRLGERHDALRTALVRQDGVPVQRVLPSVRVTLDEVDLRSRTDPEATADRVAVREARRPFDLAVAPLLRATLLRLRDQEHRLVLTLHHAVFDGWSARILLRELGEAYVAARDGRPLRLPPLAVGYADVAAWHDAQVRGGAADAQLAYWRRRFETPPPPLDALRDHGRTRAGPPGGRGGRHTRTIGPDLTRAVRELGRQRDATLFITILAAFATLLHRLSGEVDVVVGAPLAGRSHAETEDVIGFFVNTVALRVDLDGEPSFEEVLRRTRGVAVEAYANQDVPFDRIVEEVAPARQAGRTPLFQVWLNLLGAPEEPPAIPQLDTEVLVAPVQGALFDLNLYVTEVGDGLRLDLVYDGDLFTGARAAVLLDQFVLLLDQAVRDPGAPIGWYTLVTGDARAVLPDHNQPLPPARGPSLLPRLWAQARRHARSAAVHDDGGALTYGELARRSRLIAAGLRAAGVVPGDTVAIWAHRDAALVASVLGTLEAGAAFLLLDPAHPPQRLARQLAAVRPRALVHLERAGPLPREVAEACPGPLVAPPGLSADGPPGAGGGPAAARGDALAYVAFTSGSTGPLPKGILGEHGPVAHFLDWYADRFALSPDDRFSVLSGLAHDPLLRDVLAPLWVGACACVPAAALLASPRDLLAWLREQRVTVAHLTPQLGRLLATAHSDTGQTLPALRLACFGGDVLLAADVAAFRALAPSAAVVNLYGTTETPQAMSCQVVATAGDALGVPLGHGIDGVQLVVTTASGRQAGIGEPGEIIVRTAHLARGYLDAQATDASFLADPFPGVRRYATGDRGRYLPDGSVEFLGRADREVKVRGYRVDPGEVDAACRVHPDVRDAVTVARTDPRGGTSLLTYALPQAGASLPAGALHRHLAERLPHYMLPSFVIEVDEVPLTPNGKVDVDALPAPSSSPAAPRAAAERRDELEGRIVAVWERLLGVASVRPDDNFFDLGGNSVLMAKLQSALQHALGRDISMLALFQYPSVRSLATYLRGDGGQAQHRQRPAAARAAAQARAQRRVAARAARDQER